MTVSFTPATDVTTSTELGTTDIPRGRVVSSRPQPGTVLFAVSGSLDLANVHLFADCVSETAGQADAMILDLSDVEFMGTAALSVLSDIDSACSARNTAMTLVIGPAAERVITAARWVPNTAPTTSVADALAAE
jgi:anti-anti-sigma factor